MSSPRSLDRWRPGNMRKPAARHAARAERSAASPTVEGNATIVRNGVAIAAHVGDAVLKGDVLQTVSGNSASPSPTAARST